MSRIGKKPIQLPQGVTVTITDSQILVKGPKVELKQNLHPLIKVEQKDNDIIVNVTNTDEKKEKALWGTFRQLIYNMIIGVTEGFKRQLEVNGVGYRVALQSKNLVLNVGYSNPVEFKIPDGLTCEVEKNLITLSGADKQLIGETAAQIRKIRKPEPYKGKGIKYLEEVIRRKAGKQAKG